ncbi:sushi, von Willebrand factor type A, EGF and pentraxin domain-containing protein 1, partial [Asbolus verrucosus]
EGITKTFTCARVLTGQYVFLQLVGVEGSLSLCEVEVFTTDEFSIDRCAPRGAPEDVQLAAFERMCYEFGVTRGGSFAEARNHCKSHNGDLIHGMSSSATAFLHAELERRKPTLKTQLVWIGAQKEPGITSRTWKWVNAPSSCGSPDKQLNTTITGSNYNVDSAIEYKCPEGHMLIGEAVRSCGKEGFWSGKAPSCKCNVSIHPLIVMIIASFKPTDVNCDVLPELEHGTVTLKDNRTTFGARALYTCHENYTLIGHEIRTCGENGSWTNSTPQCLFDWCPDPPAINGGIVDTSGRRAGNIATYSCQAGFILFGQGVLSCELGGEWSGKAPSCKYVDCGAPPNIDNGRYELSNGSTTVEIITCEEPDVPSGSYVVGYDFNVHSSIEYHCEVGHVLRGEPIHTCTKEGDWSVIDCGKVPTMLYGIVTYINETTYLDSQITYSCVKNYRLNGVVKRRCLENKQWSDSTPKCEEIRCPEPVVAEHSILSVTGNDRMYGRTLIRTADSSNVASTTYKIGALVKYRCERGYKVIGEPLNVDCGDPGIVENGKVTLASNATYYGALALYACNPNFELNGVSRRLCLDNGTWSSDAPTCAEIQCKDPDSLEGMSFKVSTHSVGGVAVYSCPRGHIMQGNSTRVCQKKGNWNGQAPSCIAVDCKHPGTIENGRVIVMNGTTYNSAIEYHCIPNYERTGPYLRKCMENGDWSGDEPRCEMSSGEPQETSNLGTSIGIGAGVVVFLLILLGIIYLKLRKPIPVKNTENVEGAERKEDRNAAVMSYATLSDRNGYAHTHLSPNIYENIHDENMYDAPYEETSRDSGTYEPEPIGRSNGNMVTINGV